MRCFMSMTTQNWECVEARQDLTEARKAADPMAFLAVLVILAAIAVLMTIFCSIGSAQEHSPDRLQSSPTSFSLEE